MHNIKEYMEHVLKAPTFNAVHEMPRDSVSEYVFDMMVSGRLPSNACWWPFAGTSMNRFFTIALHELPPGKSLFLKTAKPIPRELLKKSGDADGSVRTHEWEITAPGLDYDVLA